MGTAPEVSLQWGVQDLRHVFPLIAYHTGDSKSVVLDRGCCQMVENNVVGDVQRTTSVCLIVTVVAVENDVLQVWRELWRYQPLL